MSTKTKVEKEIKEMFPGWEGKFIYRKGHTWTIETTSTKEWDYLFPGCTKEQVDAKAIRRVTKIIKKYYPNARLTRIEKLT